MDYFRRKTEKAKIMSKIVKVGNGKPPGKISDGDRPPARAKGEKVTSEELRCLRELIRQRYSLDLKIWSLRKVGSHNRKVVEADMNRADAMLLSIKARILSMDSRDYFNTDGEYQMFKQVKDRVMADGKREWIKNPPWDED
jgi:hypothetical protein